MQHDRDGALRLGESLLVAARTIGQCNRCNTLTEQPICATCESTKRDAQLLCVVESPADQLVIEQSLAYGGLIRQMGRLSKPMESAARIRSVCWHAEPTDRRRYIATSFTGGDATAHYITQLVRERDPQLKVTRLARGVPAGAELEYTDVNTVAQAMLDRRAD